VQLQRAKNSTKYILNYTKAYLFWIKPLCVEMTAVIC